MVRIIVAVAAAASAVPGHVYADQNWDGDNAVGNFSFDNNWFGDSEPSWNFASGNLNFAFSNNPSQTSLFFDYGSWRTTNDIYWLSTYGKSMVLSSNGNGIDFTTRLENQSNFAQTISMPMSGGKNGVTEIQLNPVNASLTISGTIFNDNNVDYVVYGSTSSTSTTLTLNTPLGPNASTPSNIDFTVAGGRNSLVNVLASQVWAGTTTVNSGSFTTGSGVTLASPTIVVAGGTVTTTSANTFVDSAALTVNSGRLSIGGSDTIGSLAGTGGTVALGGNNLTLGGNETKAFAGALTGSGTFTKNGSGTLTLSGTSSAFTGVTNLAAGGLLVTGSLATARVDVGGSATLGGSGSITGNVAFADGAKFQFDPVTPLTIYSGSATFANFGVDDVAGLSESTPNGTYTLIAGTVNFANVQNVGVANTFEFAVNKQAYFEAGSLNLVVVPEPGALPLVGFGIAAGLVLRRKLPRRKRD